MILASTQLCPENRKDSTCECLAISLRDVRHSRSYFDVVEKRGGLIYSTLATLQFLTHFTAYNTTYEIRNSQLSVEL